MLSLAFALTVSASHSAGAGPTPTSTEALVGQQSADIAALKLEMSKLKSRLDSMERGNPLYSHSPRNVGTAAPARLRDFDRVLVGEATLSTRIGSQSVDTCRVNATCDLFIDGNNVGNLVSGLIVAKAADSDGRAASLAASLEARYPYTNAEALGENIMPWGHNATEHGEIFPAVADDGTVLGACFPGSGGRGLPRLYFSMNASIVHATSFSVSMWARITTLGHASLFMINGVTDAWSNAVFWLFTSHLAERGIHDDDDSVVNGTSRRHVAAVVNRYDTRYFDNHYDTRQTLTTGMKNAHYKVGAWTHLVATYEYSEGGLAIYRLYLQGEQVNQYIGVPLIDTEIDLAGKEILVGESCSSGSASCYGLGGIVRDLRVYSKSVDRDEVRFLFDTTAPPTATSSTNAGGCWVYNENPTTSPTAGG